MNTEEYSRDNTIKVKEEVKEVVKEEVKEVVKEEVKEVVKEVVKEEVNEEVKEEVKEVEEVVGEEQLEIKDPLLVTVQPGNLLSIIVLYVFRSVFVDGFL